MAEVCFETSGSTGESMPVVRSEAQLAQDAAALVREFPEIWSSSPTVVASIRPEHMYGALWRVRAPKLAGSAVDSSIVFSVEELIAAKAKYGTFLLVTTPSFLERAIRHADFPQLRGGVMAVVTSGSALRRETALAVRDLIGGCPLEIYGSTETGTVAYRRQDAGEALTLVDGVTARRLGDGRLEVSSPWAANDPLVMNDLVDFVTPRCFRLLGRVDRRVKILEQYVSLTAIETALAGHPFIARARAETYGEDIPRIGALIVLSRVGVDRLVRSTFTALCRQLREDLRGVIGDGAFPRRLRFVRELPTNAQGKTTVAAVRSVLAEWCREPVVTDWSPASDSLTAKFVFPPDCECFRGHFPGCPILPGVAQLYFLRHFARQAFDDFPEVATFHKLKFQKLVLPSREVDFTLKREGAQFEFAFSGPKGRYSSGVVVETVR